MTLKSHLNAYLQVRCQKKLYTVPSAAAKWFSKLGWGINIHVYRFDSSSFKLQISIFLTLELNQAVSILSLTSLDSQPTNLHEFKSSLVHCHAQAQKFLTGLINSLLWESELRDTKQPEVISSRLEPNFFTIIRNRRKFKKLDWIRFVHARSVDPSLPWKIFSTKFREKKSIIF